MNVTNALFLIVALEKSVLSHARIIEVITHGCTRHRKMHLSHCITMQHRKHTHRILLIAAFWYLRGEGQTSAANLMYDVAETICRR